MKKLILLFYLFLTTIFSFSQGISPKSCFDIQKQENFKRQNENLKSGTSWLAYQTSKWQYTLLEGNFFTIGTNNGFSTSIIDDDCQITFGHPFALSSFPYISIDGTEYGFYSLFASENNLLLENDSLKNEIIFNNTIKTTFYINELSANVMELIFEAENISAEAHDIGLFLLFDAALGKWGDGFLFQNSTFVENTSTISSSIPDYFEIYEKSTVPEGIKLKIYNNITLPDEIKIGNWQNLFYDDEIINQIFDLALKYKWNETTLQPGEFKSFNIKIELTNPNFGYSLFARCDVPTALSIENGMIFPSTFVSTDEIYSIGSQFSNLKLKIVGNNYIEEWISEEPFNSSLTENPVYSGLNVNVFETYDSVVVPVTYQIVTGSTVINEFTKNLFIPAAPFSYEGLEVSIDTVYENIDSINISFNVIKQSSGQYIYELKKNNIFPFEDVNFITDFELMKDTAGGINNADIVFVLDVTGSMGDEINDVKNNIIEFTDSLSANGINYQLGLVTFLDIIENVYSFTDNPQTFYNYVAAQYAHGGDDTPENSLEALMVASDFDFRPNSKRIFIWITDADYHITDNVTQLDVSTVVNSLLMNGIQVHCVGATYYYDDYEPIILPTGGNFYDIYGNFRDIILEVSHMQSSPNYLLKYKPTSALSLPLNYTIEVHYAGLGGSDNYLYDIAKEKKLTSIISQKPEISVFPNPITNNSVINISNAENCKITIEIFDISGKKISSSDFYSEKNNLNCNISDFMPYNLTKNYGVYMLKINAVSENSTANYSKTMKLITY